MPYSSILPPRAARAPRLILPLAAAFAAFAFLPLAAAAQDALPPRPDAEDVCLGFAFGAWTPRLDWRHAGHGERIDSAGLQRAPQGRDWASDAGARADTVLMLFPAWWPAGVAVTVPTRALAVGDTVAGSAIALVADGQRTAPRASLRAWRVPCDRRASGGGAGRAPR